MICTTCKQEITVPIRGEFICYPCYNRRRLSVPLKTTTKVATPSYIPVDIQ